MKGDAVYTHWVIKFCQNRHTKSEQVLLRQLKIVQLISQYTIYSYKSNETVKKKKKKAGETRNRLGMPMFLRHFQKGAQMTASE